MHTKSKELLKPFFSFKQLKNSSNKLVNKKLNVIRVDDKTNTVECKQTQNDPTVTRAEQSLPLEHSASYFQVEILETTDDDCINIGIITKDCNQKQFAGKTLGSFGYHKGVLYLDKKKVSTTVFSQKLANHDRLGFGINCYEMTFFVVKNQEIIEQGVQIPKNWSDFFPAVGLSFQSQSVRFHFSLDKFQFNLERYCAKIEAKFMRQLQANNNIQSAQIYSLVHEYLSFNRYTETLSLMNKKKFQFAKLSKYTKNQENMSGLDFIQRREMEELMKTSSIRSRIMSERLNQDEQSILMRRKNTEVIGEAQLERKNSEMQNVSMVPLSSGASWQEQKKEEQVLEEFDENMMFLDHDRYVIHELIKLEKIQQAYTIVNKKMPNLLEQKYVLAYFKAHIFLKKIKDGLNKEALQYSKEQQNIFKEYYSTHCLFYNSMSEKAEWKPLNTIFYALAYNTQEYSKLSHSCRDLVSPQQFITFANYINQLILKKLGYITCSRLNYFCSHLNKVRERISELKGMFCGVQLNL